jgi:hypothetical protein
MFSFWEIYFPDFKSKTFNWSSFEKIHRVLRKAPGNFHIRYFRKKTMFKNRGIEGICLLQQCPAQVILLDSVTSAIC